MEQEIDTFGRLMRRKSIQIPIIQRDYAQGRRSSKATLIRREFIKDIIACLDDNNGKIGRAHV